MIRIMVTKSNCPQVIGYIEELRPEETMVTLRSCMSSSTVAERRMVTEKNCH
jgi:hypothetical protein